MYTIIFFAAVDCIPNYANLSIVTISKHFVQVSVLFCCSSLLGRGCSCPHPSVLPINRDTRLFTEIQLKKIRNRKFRFQNATHYQGSQLSLIISLCLITTSQISLVSGLTHNLTNSLFVYYDVPIINRSKNTLQIINICKI